MVVSSDHDSNIAGVAVGRGLEVSAGLNLDLRYGNIVEDSVCLTEC